MRPRASAGTAIAVAAMLMVAGCGAEQESAADQAKIEELEQRVADAERKADDAKAQADSAQTASDTAIEEEPAQTVSDEEPTASVDEPDDSSESDCITVPDVVGKDHQLAQDTMQAAGLYNLVEEDATGQDRMLLWDRNWTVVGQDPPGGTTVSEDAVITLRSKKDGE